MKTISTSKRQVKSVLFFLIAASVAVAVFLPVKNFISRQISPFGITLPDLDGKDMVDPRASIRVDAVGWGTRLSKVELRDENGKVLAEVSGQTSVTFFSPLAFGTRHTLTATVERPWLRQEQTRILTFTTVGIPILEGPKQRMLSPDATVTLQFDRPVGEVLASGDLTLKSEPEHESRSIRLTASNYEQDKTFKVQLNIKTVTGVPVPPIELALTSAPALTVQANTDGLSNAGLALPLQITFSEPLAERAGASRSIRVQTVDGKAISGKWEWLGQRHLRFVPQPLWPASSTVQVDIDQQGLKTIRGGMLEKPWATRFSTGTDRRIYVFLDRQQLVAEENGQVVRTIKVSTGKSATPTVTGSFYIYDRYRHKTMRSEVGRGQKGFYEVEDVPFAQFFHKGLALHGAFWHNAFGHPASHGCVNLSTKDKNKRWPNAPEDAGWLYRWAALGVPVKVTREAPESEDHSTSEREGGEIRKGGSAAKTETGNSSESMVKLESSMTQEGTVNP